MPISWKTLRAVLLVIAVIVSIRDYGATLYASYDLCSDVCSSSSCATECYENEMEFENGNSISCLDYGVYDTGQACCGDGNCNNGEDTGSCYADCYDPNPPGPQVAVLVNGSLNPSPPDWISYGSAMFNAVWGTYGVQPVTFFWSQNSAGEVTGAYEGITDGAIDLADAINTLPAGNVNIVAHSHGGNVSIIATGYINRQIQHLVELGTPVNWELPRYVSGYGVRERCLASSYDDMVQLLGTSPPQVGAYFGARFLEHYWADAAADAWALGDYEAWAARLALEVVWSNVAFYYWATAREEWDGTTVGFSGPGHSDMHEPGVWYSLPWYCRAG